MDGKKIVEKYTNSDEYKNDTTIIDTMKILHNKYGHTVSENLLLIMNDYINTGNMATINALPSNVRRDFSPIVKNIDYWLEKMYRDLEN